jgi:hypothetical protein
VHRAGAAREASLELAAELSIPIRHFTPGISYCGGFYGQDDDGNPRPGAVGVEALVTLLEGLEPGFTELVCHPGCADEALTSYAAPRAEEIRTLCDPRVRAAIEQGGIELCAFADAHAFPSPERPGVRQ